MRDKAETLRRRLKIRAWRRGMLEMDLLLGRYADLFLEKMDEAELRLFEDLLEENDQDLFAWSLAQGEIPQRFQQLLNSIVKISAEK